MEIRKDGAHGLTVLTPVIDGNERKLQEYLRVLAGGARSPLTRIGAVHFARCFLLSDLVYPVPGQLLGRPARNHLLFSSIFDGDLRAHLESLRSAAGVEVDRIWGHCVGYPGSHDARRFGAYLRRHRISSEHFLAAYPQATVAQVISAVQLHGKLRAFAIESQSLKPLVLRERFLAAFPTGVQL